MTQAAKLDASLFYLAHDCIGVKSRLDKVFGSLGAGVIECNKT